MVAPLLVAGGTLLADRLLAPKDDSGEAAIKNAIAQFSGIQAPSAQDLQVILQKLVYQGDITAEQAHTYLQSPSAMEDIQGSPEAKSAQLQSLAQLGGIATGSGMNPMDEANLETVRARNAATERGSREAIMQNARERGMGSGGNELLDEMVNGQESAGRANTESLDVAAQARQRSLEAMAAAGTLGGQIEGQQFGEQAGKAAAADTINKFNSANLNTNEAANVAARNAAIARNATEKQGISDTNTGITNEQAVQNAGAKQQAFADQVTKASGMSGQFGNLANTELENQKNKNTFTGGLLGTSGKLLSDETKKKDIAEAPAKDLDEFMASLDPKMFKYKDPGAPGASEGDNVGVMAQDVEKTPVGKTMVANTKDGKMLDVQKGFEVMLAAIGAMHRKMEEEKGGHNG